MDGCDTETTEVTSAKAKIGSCFLSQSQRMKVNFFVLKEAIAFQGGCIVNAPLNLPKMQRLLCANSSHRHKVRQTDRQTK